MHGSPETHLQDADLAWAIATGAIIAAQCALLSVLIVLKRMAFIGQGVSHAALGGVGIAAILGVTQGPAYFAIVGAACVLAALLVGWLSDRRVIASDTAIGIVLVASMALGVTLLQIAEQAELAEHAEHAAQAHEAELGWESLLFGSLTDVGALDAIVAGVLLLTTIALALRFGRAVLFWAFDERSACAFGSPTGAARFGLMIALAATIVASMKLVGIILATALLVLPGACALRLSRRLPGVLACSLTTAMLALAAGLAGAAIFSIPVGGAVVLALVACYALTWPLARLIPAPAPTLPRTPPKGPTP
jgi:zinc transport system permease protein